ncbi:hypothetical protein BJ170DRAFT_615991 [Xylariales sp. AK1849]|nr:hypothetical protein BJ170DRAFT_615991 [Xylariales sp. AK1849]
MASLGLRIPRRRLPSCPIRWNFIKAVVLGVSRSWLFGRTPQQSNGRAVLVRGGGGYTQLMVGRKCIVVTRWLTSLGFLAFVLVHRFPTANTGPQAPVDDARRALCLLEAKRLVFKGMRVCGLSTGGRLAAALLASCQTSRQYVAAQLNFANISQGLC